MEHFITAIKRYADFEGRDTRKQFWMFTLFYFIFAVVAGIIDSVTGLGWVELIFALALLIPSLSIGARRLHDTGRSGWWQLLVITLIGVIVLIVFYVQDSKPGTNKYGPNPKGVEA